MKLNFLEKRLATVNEPMTKTNMKILAYLQKNPQEFARLNIKELAEEIDTSVAAITRFAKKLGYEKLTDLKMAISKDEGAIIEVQYQDINKNDEVDEIASKVLSKNVEAIHGVGQMLKKQDLEKAVDYMLNAERMMFTGLGGSASVAQDAHHKFRRLGIISELITDVNSQMIAASVGGHKDLIIVISNEGANKELNLALKVAKENGIKIIAITQFADSPLFKIADVSLLTLSYNFHEKPVSLISRIASYSLVDIIYVAYCMKTNHSLDDQLANINENMKLLKNYDN